MNISNPVMISGATGYVAGWIVKKLLDQGATIHAPVRSPEKAQKIKHLKELEADSPGKIVFFKADLLKPDSYQEAMKGCEIIMHTASPFLLNVKDKQKGLIEPAIKGTQNILESVNQTPSIKKVILTSSCAAICGDNKDLLSIPNQTLTEENWNTTSSPTHQAYSYSKVTAEKKAWEIAKNQDRWKLITINPSLVIGPGISADATSGSYEILKQIHDGDLKMGAPDLRFGAVHVSDVADAHINAALSDTASGRYILSAKSTSIFELANFLKSKFGDKYPLPKKVLPKWFFWLIAPFIGQTRKEVSNNFGFPWQADNTKSKKELKIDYHDIEPAFIEMFQHYIENKS